ncbi:MAG TPA: metal-sulfur cluster assembly factor [Rhodoplanes sp.]|jgi:metal-sulfur cluster biosynthetic enzyme|nr:metal-sulfur cluster assembly factor [Rhodoplanes sp.]
MRAIGERLAPKAATRNDPMNDPDILRALKEVHDPELGINIVDLGLVYLAERTREGIMVEMTMTTPTCPIGEMLVMHAEAALRRHFADVEKIRVHLIWDPPWSPDLMTDEGRRALDGPGAGRTG